LGLFLFDLSRIFQYNLGEEIARLFNISIRSVEFHRDSIRKKLGLSKKKMNLSK